MAGLVISKESGEYRAVYKMGKLEGDGLACDSTRRKVKLDFTNYGMYVNPVLIEILNSDEEVIYSSLVRQGESRAVVYVDQLIVPGEEYWLRKTYYDVNMNVISALMLQVEAYIGF